MYWAIRRAIIPTRLRAARRLRASHPCCATLRRLMTSRLAVVVGERLARYGFGEGHPFGPDRHGAFLREFEHRGFAQRALILEPRLATDDELLSFHTPSYVNLVRERSATGQGMLDEGDTPAFRGVCEAASTVVGATLHAADAIMSGAARHGFVPLAGLHHAA